MSRLSLSTRRARSEAWDQILLRVVQVQGPEILKNIVQQSALAGERPQPKFEPSVLAAQLVILGKGRWAGLKKGVKQLRHGPNRREPLEKATLETLSGMGFIGGLFFGMQLPQIDLKMSTRAKDRDSLILHAASLMMTRVAVDWVQEVLRRTLLAPTLSANEAKFLRGISKVLDASQKGVERGWSARQIVSLWLRFRRSPLSKQHHLATDARALKILQEWIERFGKG